MGKIQHEFIKSLQSIGDKECFLVERFISGARDTNNIIKLCGSINCLVYFHIRTKEPLRWGVTKGRIEEIKNLDKEWFLIFLFEPPTYKGFILTEANTLRHIGESLWPVGKGEKSE